MQAIKKIQSQNKLLMSIPKELYKYVAVNSLNAKVAIIKKPVNWIALQPLIPGPHLKVIYTYANLWGKTTGLFKCAWTFNGYQALKG